MWSIVMGKDADLGQRLRAAGYAVVFDPALVFVSFEVGTALSMPVGSESDWKAYESRDSP
jgi:hypothetical protein